MHARWYDPKVGTFTSHDTITNNPTPHSANANPYGYAAGAPINAVDPAGYSSCGGDGGRCEPPTTEPPGWSHRIGSGGGGNSSGGNWGGGSGGTSAPKPRPPPADPCAHNHHCKVPPSPKPKPDPKPKPPPTRPGDLPPGTPTIIGAPTFPTPPSLTPSQPGSSGLPQPGSQRSTTPNPPINQACSVSVCGDGDQPGVGIPDPLAPITGIIIGIGGAIGDLLDKMWDQTIGIRIGIIAGIISVGEGIVWLGKEIAAGVVAIGKEIGEILHLSKQQSRDKPKILSREEWEAIEAHDAKPPRPYDQKIYNRARQKQLYNEKMAQRRNSQKRKSK